MSKLKSHIQKPIAVSSLIRRTMLSWLLAILIEYLLLPRELRNMAELDGLAQMSLVRIIGITCSMTFLLTGISFFITTRIAERWGIVTAFVLLAVVGL